jgi:SAM-dependent methyltransferase
MLVTGAVVTPELARHLPASGIGSLMAYWRFYRAVAAAQLADWLGASACRGSELLVDMSGPHLSCAAQAATAGHTVVHVAPADHAGGVVTATPAAARPVLTAAPKPRHASPGRAGRAGTRRLHGGSVVTVRADPAALPFLDDRCVDGVIADDRTFSRHLFTEQAIAEAARVLRPGGRLFACFDSLVLGMAILAEQRHWAELTDLPSAEVVLVPWPDGSITRCFGIEHVRDLFAEARLDITSIRPRTMLSPTTVEHVLGRNKTALMHLVRAELAADPDESVGIHLVVSARKRRPRPKPRAHGK